MEVPEVEAASAGQRRVSVPERLLAGLCASLMVLGVAAVITHTSPRVDTREAQQVAAGPSAEQLAAEDTTTTTAPPPDTTLAGESALAPLGPVPSHPGGPSFVATATVPSVDVFSSPTSSTPTRSLANPQDSGAPLVMLVRSQQPGWVNVFLPIRPNGSSGWVKSGQVGVSQTNYYIVIGLSPHRITVFNGSSVVLDERIGLGAGGTPTPTGLFYIKELFKPPNAGGAYGPYAYGLSAFSDVLFSFGGGPGTVGVHGTNEPSSLGRNVSHGCIRMSNSGVTTLAKLLPLGVPVQINA
ncbi:MAG: L,D-transpeptidase [Actinomycetota bacterium]|nr:L,D-transpeptidase [Actinomycetota bacterium]